MKKKQKEEPIFLKFQVKACLIRSMFNRILCPPLIIIYHNPFIFSLLHMELELCTHSGKAGSPCQRISVDYREWGSENVYLFRHENRWRLQSISHETPRFCAQTWELFSRCSEMKIFRGKTFFYSIILGWNYLFSLFFK